jgi:hypothetical protein
MGDSVTSRTAVYGPVRTVVWQGSVGDRRPYADLTAQRLVIHWTKSRHLAEVIVQRHNRSKSHLVTSRTPGINGDAEALR